MMTVSGRFRCNQCVNLGAVSRAALALLMLAGGAALPAAQGASGQSTTPAPAAAPAPAPSPTEIVAAAPAADWVAIPAEDLIVMDLAQDARGRPRRVVIQLIPAPFSQGWVANIRRLVAARWYDGISINRVQDNYVVQWGDADGEDAAKAKPLPEGLKVMVEAEYSVSHDAIRADYFVSGDASWAALFSALENQGSEVEENGLRVIKRQRDPQRERLKRGDPYGAITAIWRGWPLATAQKKGWPVHCYGMVGVGRGFSPDTGSGAELYTVIGHAPRHLDRNIALVGRVIKGIEHLSALPRGTGPLGFYESADERLAVVSVRLGSEVAGLPRYQYLSTESQTFDAYADARANRRDPFFIVPAGGADICNIPVPVRRVAE